MQDAEPESNIRTVPVTLKTVTRHMVLDTGGGHYPALARYDRRTAIADAPQRCGGSMTSTAGVRAISPWSGIRFGHLHRNDAGGCLA